MPGYTTFDDGSNIDVQISASYGSVGSIAPYNGGQAFRAVPNDSGNIFIDIESSERTSWYEFDVDLNGFAWATIQGRGTNVTIRESGRYRVEIPYDSVDISLDYDGFPLEIGTITPDGSSPPPNSSIIIDNIAWGPPPPSKIPPVAVFHDFDTVTRGLDAGFLAEGTIIRGVLSQDNGFDENHRFYFTEDVVVTFSIRTEDQINSREFQTLGLSGRWLDYDRNGIPDISNDFITSITLEVDAMRPLGFSGDIRYEIVVEAVTLLGDLPNQLILPHFGGPEHGRVIRVDAAVPDLPPPTVDLLTGSLAVDRNFGSVPGGSSFSFSDAVGDVDEQDFISLTVSAETQVRVRTFLNDNPDDVRELTIGLVAGNNILRIRADEVYGDLEDYTIVVEVSDFADPDQQIIDDFIADMMNGVFNFKKGFNNLFEYVYEQQFDGERAAKLLGKFATKFELLGFIVDFADAIDNVQSASDPARQLVVEFSSLAVNLVLSVGLGSAVSFAATPFVGIPVGFVGGVVYDFVLKASFQGYVGESYDSYVREQTQGLQRTEGIELLSAVSEIDISRLIFDEAWYFANYPEAAAAVASGDAVSGLAYYLTIGNRLGHSFNTGRTVIGVGELAAGLRIVEAGDTIDAFLGSRALGLRAGDLLNTGEVSLVDYVNSEVRTEGTELALNAGLSAIANRIALDATLNRGELLDVVILDGGSDWAATLSNGQTYQAFFATLATAAGINLEQTTILASWNAGDTPEEVYANLATNINVSSLLVGLGSQAIGVAQVGGLWIVLVTTEGLTDDGVPTDLSVLRQVGDASGNDIWGGEGSDLINGLAGDDRLWGRGGNDTLLGDRGNDTLDGGDGSDRIVGGDGNDTLIGGLGNDRMLGGAGKDTYVVDSTRDRVFETTTTRSGIDTGGIDTVQCAVSFNLNTSAGVRFVERLTLTGTANINGTGNALANILTGNTGNNTLSGEIGNDTLIGGLGNDRMLGGAGKDTYVVDSTRDRVFETTTTRSGIDAGGIDTVQSSVSFNLDTSAGVRFVERLTLTGTANIKGTGNALANILSGNTGNNTLNGEFGNDTLIGGLGNDRMLGGAGGDRFIFIGAFGNDTVNDFNRSQAGEVIDIAAIATIADFSDLIANHLTQFGANAVITAGANTITLTGVLATTLLAHDFNF